MILLGCRSAHSRLQGRRPTNQDSVLDVQLADGRRLIAVADGMGGHLSGEVASAIAIDVLLHQVRAGRPLRAAFAAANEAILVEARREPSRAGMGTTLVALLHHGATYEVANVGDSRAYRIDRAGIRQITRDHSFAAEAAQHGGMTPEQIARSPWRNALTRSLGSDAEVEVDVFGPFETGGGPHLVLLCSDGLYRVLSDRVIWQHLLRGTGVGPAADSLGALALQNRSDDNISVAMVEFGSWFTASSPAIHSLELAPRGAPAAREEERTSAARLAPVLPQPRALAADPAAASRVWRLAPRILNENVIFALCAVLVLWIAVHFVRG